MVLLLVFLSLLSSLVAEDGLQAPTIAVQVNPDGTASSAVPHLPSLAPSPLPPLPLPPLPPPLPPFPLPHVHLTWRLPVGCDFSGFFCEWLGYAVGLAARDDVDLSLDMGRCDERILSQLSSREASIMRALQQPRSTSTEHAGEKGVAAEGAAAEGAEVSSSASPGPELAAIRAIVQHTAPRSYPMREAKDYPCSQQRERKARRKTKGKKGDEQQEEEEAGGHGGEGGGEGGGPWGRGEAQKSTASASGGASFVSPSALPSYARRVVIGRSMTEAAVVEDADIRHLWARPRSRHHDNNDEKKYDDGNNNGDDDNSEGDSGGIISSMWRQVRDSFMSSSSPIPPVDSLWVPTRWHQKLYRSFGVTPDLVDVLPEAIDTSFFDPALCPARSRPGSSSAGRSSPTCFSSSVPPRVRCPRVGEEEGYDFTFYSAFKFEHRKGWDVLLRAYFREFRQAAAAAVAAAAVNGGETGVGTQELPKDAHDTSQADVPALALPRVRLRLRSYRPSWERGSKDLLEAIKDFARQEGLLDESKWVLPTVEWIREDLSREGMRDLLCDVDALVLPTRGEGWGLPVTEAMAMGLPVVVTNASGPTE